MASDGPPPVPATRAIVEPITSDVTSSVNDRAPSRQMAAGAASLPDGPWVDSSVRRKDGSVMTGDPSAAGRRSGAPRTSEGEDGPYPVLVVHEVEGLVDLIERAMVRDEAVERQLAVEVQ